MKIMIKKSRVIVMAVCSLGILICSSMAWAKFDSSLFIRANDAYRTQQYSQAIKYYERLLEQQVDLPGVYYNLANSYFRMNKLGRAIVNYERALMHDPRNSDIISNLKYAKSLIEYRIEDKRNWYLKAGERLLEHFTENEIGLLAAIGCFLFLFTWVIVLFFTKKIVWGWKRQSLLVLVGLSALLVVGKQLETHFFRDAIVTVQEAEIRYGPSDRDQVAFRLSEGVKVYVLNHRENWSRIVLVNGAGGWVKDSDVVEVRRS